jgi:hypothetical protein
MTAAVAAMHAGRERAVAERQLREDNQARAYLAWVKADADAHRHYATMLRFFGRDHADTTDSYIAWRRVAESLPCVPTNASVKRVLGVGSLDD